MCLTALYYSYRNHGFDIERVKAAAKQLEGVHDFRSFMHVSKEQRTVFSIRFWFHFIQL